MEEFRKFCAGLTGVPKIVSKIDDLNYTSFDDKHLSGVDCLQNMADDLIKAKPE